MPRVLLTAGIILFLGISLGCSTHTQEAPLIKRTQSEEPEPFKMPVRTTPTKARMMWASSHIYEPCPALEFGEWLTEKPDLEDKFIIIEFWRTWCSACKKGTPFLNEIQKRYPDDVVVVGVNAQSTEKIDSYDGPKKSYYLARDKASLTEKDAPSVAEEVDTGASDCSDGACVSPDSTRDSEQGQMESYFGVWGWPHVVILEPTERAVVWEGFPSQPGYELTEEIILKYISIHKESK